MPTTHNAGFAERSVFAPNGIPSPDSTALSPPVTITYSGASPALLINDTGSNKGVEALINNTSNASSALYGQTNGSGAGLTGYNTGTSGPAGKFAVTNAASYEPGVSTTTSGRGSALLATITDPSNIAAAIDGESSGVDGTGVTGQGGLYGVFGQSPHSSGVYGNTVDGDGVEGHADSGDAIVGESGSGNGLVATSDSSYGASVRSNSGVGLSAYSGSTYGIVAESAKGTGLYAKSDGDGHGVTGHSVSSVGVYGSSDKSYGVYGQGNSSFGVVGEDSGNGVGVYGKSKSGYAGYFDGKVGATSYITVSDRSVKTRIKAISGRDILGRVDELPVTSWAFKSDPEKSHVGPMAQDFHAAFGLDGDDDKHINLTDIAGVSLVAIKELSREMKQKDAQILELKQRLAAQNEAMREMKATAEMVMVRMIALEQRR